MEVAETKGAENDRLLWCLHSTMKDLDRSAHGDIHDYRLDLSVGFPFEAPPPPPQHGVWRDDRGGVPPPSPHPGQPDPEEPLAAAELGPARRSPVYGELLAQGEVLKRELAVATAEDREKSKQVKQRAEHRGELSPEQSWKGQSGPPDGVLAKDRRGSTPPHRDVV